MTTITRLLLLAASLLFTTINFGQTRYYVNAAATGAGDGSSWGDAFTNLQNALAASQYGDEVWVAQGTYYPTATTDRNISFELKDGVKMYGGFAGTETQLSQRDWVANETVLSGDIGVLGDSTDNSYNVVYVADVDSSTIMDGVIIKFGNADYNLTPEPTSGRRNNGGGIYITAINKSCFPKFENCIINKNNCLKNGGGIFAIAKYPFSINPQIYRCGIIENHSQNRGGGIYIIGGSYLSTFHGLNDCSFIKNVSGSEGSALFIEDTFGSSPFEIHECIYEQNESTTSGTVSYIDSNPSPQSLAVENSQFRNNTSGGSNCLFINTYETMQNVKITNCIFESNNSIYGNGCILIDAVFLTEHGVVIKNCNFVNNDSEFASCLDMASGIGGSVAVEECQFQNNSSTFGNAVTCSTLRADFTNSLFRNNNTEIEGSIICLISGDTINFTNSVSAFDKVFSPLFFCANNLYFTNSTLYDNPSIADSSFLMLVKNYTIKNSIITKSAFQNAMLNYYGFNFGPNSIADNSLFSIADCSDNLLAPITCGPNMLYNLSPQFLDPDNGDYRLSPCSPARNAGSNAIVDSLGILTDIEGSPRIQGGTVDMGAYESPSFQAIGATVTSQACGPTGLGTATLTLENGCPPYFINWSGGNSISDSSLATLSLPVGTHTITITDGRMESDTISINISPAPAITGSTNATDIACASGTGGTASIEAVGGTGAFSFLWSNGAMTATATNLPAGDYQVTVTDENGCTLTDSVTIGITGNLSLGLSIHPITCPGDSDGSATVQPIGGTMPFAWLWQDGQTTPTLDSLGGGTYFATVTDAFGCTGDIEFTITPPTAIAVDIMVVQPLCPQDFGFATANGSGGTGNLYYLWDNGATTASTMLSEGPHSVTVTDANGCSTVETVTIQAPPQLQVSLAVEPDVLCFGASNGTIIVTASGGSGQYGWSGPTENLSAGTYTITISDSNGCMATASATIAEHLAIMVSDTVTDASSPTASDGSIVLNSVSGGSGSGYQFSWSPSGSGNVISTEQNLTGVPRGDYSLTVTDSQGCTAVFNFSVDFNSAAGEAADNPFGAAIVPNPSSRAGASVLLKANTISFKISMFDAQGRLVIAEQTSGNKFGLPKGLAAGSYRVVLENGKERMVLTWVVGE